MSKSTNITNINNIPSPEESNSPNSNEIEDGEIANDLIKNPNKVNLILINMNNLY